MGELQIPLTPKPMQVEFSEKIKTLRQKREGFEESEHLFEVAFASLQHRAFSGQL
jgi:hypothetical protein